MVTNVTGSGNRLPTFLQVNGDVNTAIPDGAGGWYIGGSFTRVGSTSRNYIAHILADYTVDPAWNPNADRIIQTLAVSGSTVYAGGRFASSAGRCVSAWPGLTFPQFQT